MWDILNNLLVVAGQVVTLFLLMGVGFVMAKLGRLSPSTLGQLSNLLLYVAIPCVIISSMQIDPDPGLLRNIGIMFLITVAYYVVFCSLVPLLFRSSPEDTRVVLRFSTVYANNGFMGMPLLQAVLGEGAVIFAVVATVTFNLFQWTHGVILVGGQKKISVRQALINPGTIGLAVGLVLFLSGLRLPSMVGNAVDFLGDLNTPLAMVVIGGQMASTDLGRQDGEGYLVHTNHFVIPSMSLAPMSTHTASAAMPPLPGRAKIWLTAGFSFIFFMMACSLPPPPTTIIFIITSGSMVEKSHACHGHDHVVSVAGFYDIIVPDGTARLSHIGDAALGSPFDIISEWEESIGAQNNTFEAGQIFSLLFSGERLRLFCEKLLPIAISYDIFVVLGKIYIYGVVPVRTLDLIFERQAEHLVVLAQVPFVSLFSGQPGAVDPGLLSGAHAYDLSVFRIAYGIGLGIFEGYEGYDHVPPGFFRQVFVICNDIGKQARIYPVIISPLLESHSEYLLFLQLGRNIRRVYFYYIVVSFSLGL